MSEQGKIKVLLPYDESGFSRKIIPQVERLFPSENATLYLLHVLKPQTSLAQSPRVRYRYGSQSSESNRHQFDKDGLDSHTRLVKDRLEQEARHLRRKGYEVTALLRSGEVIVEIVALIEEEAIEAIAMATHGYTGVGQLLFGSVAQAVLARVAIPVVMLRSDDT